MRPFYHLKILPSLSMVVFKFLTYVKKRQKNIFTALVLQFYIKCDRVVDHQEL